MSLLSPDRKSRVENRKCFAWQGWRLELPARWNPVKLEGDYDNGYALIADLHRPQLGVRWRTVGGKRFDAARWASGAMRDEVGKLSADRAKPGEGDGDAWPGALLFLEPQPPGRDVWVAHSRTSGRVIEIVHHVRRRERVLQDVVLPDLSDSPADGPRAWAVFDLACVVPAKYELAAHRLNAGDLTLSFALKRRGLIVRQIALAEMALRRQPIDRWLAGQERAVQKRYKPDGSAEPLTIGEMQGVRRTSIRRTRFGFMRWLPTEIITHALHDRHRDRLILLQGSDEAILREVAESLVQ